MDKLLMTRKNRSFIDYERGGDGIATLIADNNFKKKVNRLPYNKREINGRHAKFSINHGDYKLEMYLDDESIQIKIFRYVIVKVSNGYELRTKQIISISDEFIELSLNDMKAQPYYDMVVAAMNKCMDENCTISYYSKESEVIYETK